MVNNSVISTFTCARAILSRREEREPRDDAENVSRYRSQIRGGNAAATRQRIHRARAREISRFRAGSATVCVLRRKSRAYACVLSHISR